MIALSARRRHQDTSAQRRAEIPSNCCAGWACDTLSDGYGKEIQLHEQRQTPTVHVTDYLNEHLHMYLVIIFSWSAGAPLPKTHLKFKPAYIQSILFFFFIRHNSQEGTLLAGIGWLTYYVPSKVTFEWKKRDTYITTFCLLVPFKFFFSSLPLKRHETATANTGNFNRDNICKG